MARPAPPAPGQNGALQMFFWIYQDAQTEWRWTLSAANNKKIADSGEGYSNRRIASRDHSG